MNILRRVVVFLAVAALPFLLWVLAIDVGLVHTFTNPTTIKKVAADSGIYSSAVSSALDQTKQISTGYGEVPLTNSAIKEAANAAFPPALVQQNTEASIDSIYSWLDGKIAQPDFKIDLSGAKQSFATAVGTIANQNATGLPACTAKVSTLQFDIFSSTCLPKGLTPASVQSQVEKDISSSQDFLGNPIITASDIKSPNSGQSFFADQGKNVPNTYRQFKFSPLVLAVMAILVAAVVVLASTTRRKGLRRFGIVILIIGLLVSFAAWGVQRGTQKHITSLKLDNKVLQDKVQTLVSNIAKDTSKTYYMIGGGYVALGLVAILGSLLIKKRGGDLQEEEHSVAPSEPPKEPEELPELTQKEFEEVAGPPPVPKKIKAVPKPKAKSVKKIKVS